MPNVNDNLYLISGRVCGDDDDTQHIVESPSEAEANAKFIAQLQADCGGDEKTDVFVILSMPLTEAIDQRLK